MNIKSFKAKFLKQHPINQKAIIANIEWTLKTGKTTNGTIIKDSDRKPTEDLLVWCKSKAEPTGYTDLPTENSDTELLNNNFNGY